MGAFLEVGRANRIVDLKKRLPVRLPPGSLPKRSGIARSAVSQNCPKGNLSPKSGPVQCSLIRGGHTPPASSKEASFGVGLRHPNGCLLGSSAEPEWSRPARFELRIEQKKAGSRRKIRQKARGVKAFSKEKRPVRRPLTRD